MAENRAKLQKKTFLAIYELEKLGIEPIKMLKEIYDRAITAYDGHRGNNDKSDAGPAYLAQALGAAKAMASYKYPTLSAVAIKDMSELDTKGEKPMTTAEAIKIIQADPFAPPEIKNLDTSQLPEKEVDFLPIGDGNANKR